MTDLYEVNALRYATITGRQPSQNYLITDAHSDGADLDFYVWLIRGKSGDILVDTGFNQLAATAKGRSLTINPVDAMERFGVRADSIRDVVVTHLHYDHAGNLDRFPNAIPSSGPGDEVCDRSLHVQQFIASSFFSRRRDADGAPRIQRSRCISRWLWGIAPGVTLHHVGGHSDGLQVVRIETGRGPVVLASDASHCYGNMHRGNPFPVLYNVGDVCAGGSSSNVLLVMLTA